MNCDGKEESWQYKIGRTTLAGILPALLPFLLLGGISVWLYLNHNGIFIFTGLFCYENLPPEGRNNPARPDGRLIDCISCWIRRSRAGHQVPSPMLSGVSGNYVFFYPD